MYEEWSINLRTFALTSLLLGIFAWISANINSNISLLRMDIQTVGNSPKIVRSFAKFAYGCLSKEWFAISNKGTFYVQCTYIKIYQLSHLYNWEICIAISVSENCEKWPNSKLVADLSLASDVISENKHKRSFLQNKSITASNDITEEKLFKTVMPLWVSYDIMCWTGWCHKYTENFIILKLE